MKLKNLSILALALTLTISSFANHTGTDLNDKVKSAFSEKFVDAREVTWNITASYTKASFRLHDQTMFAFYSNEGDLLGISRNISSNALPIRLGAELRKAITGSWIVELFEYDTNDNSAYYATIENADQKIHLKSSSNNSWSVSKKEKKN